MSSPEQTLQESGALFAIVEALIDRSRAARAEGLYRDAAVLGAEAVRLVPDDATIRLEAARLFRDAGDSTRAEHHYLEASRMLGADAGPLTELGELYAESGRGRRALATLGAAAELDPGSTRIEAAVARLRRAGFAPDADANDAAEAALLAMDLAPRRTEEREPCHEEGLTLHRLGRPERGHWGILPTLRGLEAVRGFCVSDVDIAEVQIHLNGELIYRGATSGDVPVSQPDVAGRRKYVFNVWIDLSDLVRGLHRLECRCVDRDGRAFVQTRLVAVAAPLQEEDHPGSDALVTLSPGDLRSPDEQVAARPTVVRESRRGPLAPPPRTVLVQRVDQLGDMVVSVAAIRRLREILPGARLVGLLSNDNADLAMTMDLFDEIVAIEFRDDPAEHRRTIPLERQEELRERLAPYRFDIAIDLAENTSSRPLLLLSGAPILVGFPCENMPTLSIDVDGFTHDRMNRGETVPHANKLLGLIDWLNAQLGSTFTPVRRQLPVSEQLSRYGIGHGDRFVMLHSGARLAFSRWPHYSALASLILSRTDLKVVLLADKRSAGAELPAELRDSERFRVVEGRLPFDDLDALLASCTVMVGNDSGPKHLASLRGAKVVSIHMARNNWSEWGQEGDGFILSRKLPCAGCLIQHHPEECGRGFACISEISAEEVFNAVSRLL